MCHVNLDWCLFELLEKLDIHNNNTAKLASFFQMLISQIGWLIRYNKEKAI
jgi:hypothetical protein